MKGSGSKANSVASTKEENGTPQRNYTVRVLSDALTIMECIQIGNVPLTLEEIHRRTSIPKSSVFRLLRTYVDRGYLVKTSEGGYKPIPKGKVFRLGYAGMSAKSAFSEAVTDAIRKAANVSGIQLLVLDNEQSGSKALENVDRFLEEEVDLIIEFQAEHDIAPEVAHRIAEAQIPFIAVDIPHPKAVFFGVDNFKVGYEAGILLADHALTEWGGKVDLIVGLDFDEAGPLVGSRISAAVQALRDRLPTLTSDKISRRDCRGLYRIGDRIITECLDENSRRNILVATTGAPSALGAVAAIRKAKKQRSCVVVSQDCIDEELEEMGRIDSPLIGSISHEAHSYGPELIELALRILRGDPVPPYNFVRHRSVRKIDVLTD